MSSHSWLDVWKLFLDLLSRESIAVQIASVLGAAFVAVMALEGIRASFFPKRIVERAALRNAAPPPEAAPTAPPPPAEEESVRAALWSATPDPAPSTALETVWSADAEPAVYAPLPRITVNSDRARRSGPPRLRVIGQRKPS